MCSIVASTSLEKVRELAELNEYRGQHSHSFFVFDREYQDLVYMHRDFGPLDIDRHLELYNSSMPFFIVHQQAPTTENKDSTNIHPAQISDGHDLLWHNGIIKAKEVERLKEDLQTTNSWDTWLLLKYLNDYNTPDGIDGTFSCLYFMQNEIFVFRNEISPLFVDDELNISSTKFEGSYSLPANKMFYIDTDTNPMTLVERESFTTKENPYYFGE